MQGSIVAQVRNAAQKQNRLSTIVGAVLGGFVPLATFTLAHYEAGIHGWRERAALGLVLAGLAYSATTVYGWAIVAFRSMPKAIGFVVLLEGAMTLSVLVWLAAVALAVLVLINALATACNLAEDHRAVRRAERAERVLYPMMKAKVPVSNAKRFSQRRSLKVAR